MRLALLVTLGLSANILTASALPSSTSAATAAPTAVTSSPMSTAAAGPSTTGGGGGGGAVSTAETTPGGGGDISSPTSSPSITTEEGDDDGDEVDDPEFCVGLSNGFYENPDNCRKYYECEFDRTIFHTCPGDRLYKGDAICDNPERVECGERPVCDDDNQNCEEHHISTTPEPGEEQQCLLEDLECDDSNDGNYIPVKPCSPDYCICSNGEAFGRECPPGTVFEPNEVACVLPEDNPAC